MTMWSYACLRLSRVLSGTQSHKPVLGGKLCGDCLFQINAKARAFVLISADSKTYNASFPPLSLLPPIPVPLLIPTVHIPPSVLCVSPCRPSAGSRVSEWTETLERKLDQEMRFPVAAQIKAPSSSSQAGKDIITLTTRDLRYLE